MTAVKRATGNARDSEAEAKGKGRQGQLDSAAVSYQLDLIGSIPVNPFTRVVLSSSQGPAIQIADF